MKTRFRNLPVLVAALLALLVACRSKPTGSQAAARASGYWEPHRLLLSDARHRKLHVEIDAVKGAEPTAAEIATLKEFLGRHCRKPDGIEIVLDDVLPRESVKGTLSRKLAIAHMDGPPDGESAYLYYLFYDSAMSPDKKSQPVCLLTPYPSAILVDHQYVRARVGAQRDFRRRVLLHETGHALGLCRDSRHSDGLHCTNEDCLMNPSLYFSVSHLLFTGDLIRQRVFCTDCQDDLEDASRQPPADNLAYRGAWFVRSEPGYQVLSRPNMLFVHVGDPADVDDDDLERLRQAALERTAESKGITYSSSATNRRLAQQALPRLAKDPVKTVRSIAKELAKALSSTDPKE